jgi:hypothetical protein
VAKDATIRVFVIDDHPVVGASFQYGLSEADGLTVVGAVSSVAGRYR